MSLLVFNLLATCLLLPLVLMDSLLDVGAYAHSRLEHGLCLAGQSLTTLVTSGSISAALVIAVDQYCAVMAPLHYHRRITKVRAWLLLAGQWLFAAAMAGLSLGDRTAGRRFWKNCRLPATSVGPTDDDVTTTTTTTTAAAAAAAAAENGTTAWSDADAGNGTWTGDYDDGSWPPADLLSVLFVALSVVCYVVPLALLTCMYVRIYSAAHRNR